MNFQSILWNKRKFEFNFNYAKQWMGKKWARSLRMRRARFLSEILKPFWKFKLRKLLDSSFLSNFKLTKLSQLLNILIVYHAQIESFRALLNQNKVLLGQTFRHLQPDHNRRIETSKPVKGDNSGLAFTSNTFVIQLSLIASLLMLAKYWTPGSNWLNPELKYSVRMYVTLTLFSTQGEKESFALISSC